MQEKIELNQIQLTDVYKRLISLAAIKGIKFVYAIEKNMFKIERQFRKSENWAKKNIPVMKDNKEFQEAYSKISEECSAKDPNGKIKTDAFGAISIGDKEKYDIMMKELDEKYPEQVKAMNEFEVKYQEILNTPVEIEFYNIDYKDLPNDISLNEKRSIQFMISNDPMEKDYAEEEEIDELIKEVVPVPEMKVEKGGIELKM